MYRWWIWRCMRYSPALPSVVNKFSGLVMEIWNNWKPDLYWNTYGFNCPWRKPDEWIKFAFVFACDASIQGEILVVQKWKGSYTLTCNCIVTFSNLSELSRTVKTRYTDYFNTHPLVRDTLILLSDKLIFASLAQMDKLKFYWRLAVPPREGTPAHGDCQVGTHTTDNHFNNGPREYFYCPQLKFRKDNVFTPVCDSVHRGGGRCTPLWADNALGWHPRPPPPTRWVLKRVVRILLECILINI